MFAWLTDVCAASGFVQGEAWAYERNLLWQKWRVAFATWWPVRAVKAPLHWCSAWLARHPKVGPWTRRLWVVAGLALLFHYGPRPVADVMPWPMPSVAGWVAALVGSVAFVFYVPRLRGMAILRPLKAAILVLLTYWFYWAATSLVFHYVYRVDIWSRVVWEEVEAVWYRGGNLRWSAFWNGVGITIAWCLMLAFLWARLPRVWVYVKVWGVRVMLWLVRAGVFLCVTLLIIEFLDVGVWQIVHQFAVAVAALPYGGDLVEEAPRWAVLFVLVVVGSVFAHGVIVVLEVISDALCFCSKMLAIFWHGGIINADKYDSEEEEPRRFIGLQERFAEAERRAAVRFELYTRREAIKAATSGITKDGFQESYLDLEVQPSRPRPRKPWASTWRRWWPFGRGIETAPQSPEGSDATSAESVSTALVESALEPDVEASPADVSDPKAVGDDSVSGPMDTSGRDAFLAPDDDEPEAATSASLAVGEGEGSVSDVGAEALPSAARNESRERQEECELADARSVEESARLAPLRDHELEVAERLRVSEAAADFVNYRDDSELLSDLDDDDDPFDPETGYDLGGESEPEAWARGPDDVHYPEASAYGGPFVSDESGADTPVEAVGELSGEPFEATQGPSESGQAVLEPDSLRRAVSDYADWNGPDPGLDVTDDDAEPSFGVEVLGSRSVSSDRDEASSAGQVSDEDLERLAVERGLDGAERPSGDGEVSAGSSTSERSRDGGLGGLFDT